MDVDERLLRYFVMLSEELHFGRAAARLYISQPALSKQIRGLEESLRLNLFTRTRRQVTMTPAGAALLPRARAVLAEYESLRDDVDLLRRGQESRLTVGFIAQAANEVTPQVLRLFRDRHPNVQVDLRQSALDDNSGGLRSESVDLAIVRLPIEDEGLSLAPLFSEARVVVLPAEHRLATRDRVYLEDLRGEPRLVTATPDARFRAFALEPFGADPVAAPIGAVVSTIDEFLEAVLAGRGIAMAPESARRYYARPGVAFVDVVDATASVAAVGWHASVALSRPAADFVGVLRSLVGAAPSAVE